MSALNLNGRRLVITGVLTRDSIAFAVADRAQRLGAELVLTGFGRRLRMTERAARALPAQAPIVALDVSSPADLAELAERVGQHLPVVDGVLHSIAFAPESAVSGDFVQTQPDAAGDAFMTSAYSLKALTTALRPLMAASRPPGASVVALDFDASQAWPGYDWMGVAKAGLESIGRRLAVELADQEVRVNLVAAGPVRTPAAGGLAVFDSLLSLWERLAPLGWRGDEVDAIADVACYLLSPWSAGMTGQRVHADGGMHALGTRGPLEGPGSRGGAGARDPGRPSR